MADISTFPTITDPIKYGDNIIPLKAGGTIVTGQVVAFAKAGGSMTVVAMCGPGTDYGTIAGVAIEGAASGEILSVALDGCVVKVANASNSVPIDAGGLLEIDDNPVGGTVHEWEPHQSVTSYLPTTAGDAGDIDGRIGTQLRKLVGVALEDIAANSTGWALVRVVTQIEPLMDAATYYGTL